MGNEDPADRRERQARIYQFERRAIARIDYVSNTLVDQQVGYGARSITPERWPALRAEMRASLLARAAAKTFGCRR